MTLDRGTVVLVALDLTEDHEQRGVRTCIAVSDPSVNADRRFPLIAVVPVTSGLTKTSYALVDHLRSIDKRRVRRIFGQVSPSELVRIDQPLELFLGLGAAS